MLLLEGYTAIKGDRIQCNTEHYATGQERTGQDTTEQCNAIQNRPTEYGIPGQNSTEHCTAHIAMYYTSKHYKTQNSTLPYSCSTLHSALQMKSADYTA